MGDFFKAKFHEQVHQEVKDLLGLEQKYCVAGNVALPVRIPGKDYNHRDSALTDIMVPRDLMKYMQWFLPPEDPHVKVENDAQAYGHMERIELLNDGSRLYSTWANMYAMAPG
jgi:hypothetical protein